MHAHRTQVSEHAHALAQPQQSLLGAHLGLRVIPLGAAHCAQQNRIRSLAIRQGFVGQGCAVTVDRTAADELSVEYQVGALRFCRFGQSPDRLADHFRADPVSGQQYDLKIHKISLPFYYAATSSAGSVSMVVIKPYSRESAKACQLASMMFELAPTVLQE